MKYSYLLAPIFATFLAGCGAVSDPGSEHEHSTLHGALQDATPLCKEYSDQEYAKIEESIAGLPIFNGFAASERKELLKHFAAIPPEYRDPVIAASKRRTFEGVFKARITSAGRCSYGSDGLCRRIELSATQRDVIRYSFIHEFGHGARRAVQQASRLSSSAFDAKIREFMAEAQAHNASPAGRTSALRIRSYSFKSESEFFADTFHNYYCSPAANEFIKKYLPKNYAFFSNVFAKPMFDIASSGSGTGTDGQTGGGTASATKDYTTDLLTVFNESTASCDLEVSEASTSDGAGIFKAKVNIKGAKDSQELTLNANSPLARQLSDLRRGIKEIFPTCAS